MEGTRVWEEQVTIPTYEIGKTEKNPIFLDKRVYQGSSGKVYPYPVVETISDVKVDKEYRACFLENEYLKVMILPELGGRIQRAYDKTNDYDFVYYNHVIKPALVGLTGPWISGGIEFNWPQHHRPTTFLPTDYLLETHADGSASVLCHDTDQMYGTKCVTKISLYPGKAYIEIEGQLYNGTPYPQTFLWWANPAVPMRENTYSVFPPDVHAVMDHGKRDVSRFPIATGVYYKKDYSEGVDISKHMNIPVPTSYMAEKSRYDFVGGYDADREAGILHVADHHISPGKKQWTWGNGDFGHAWDRNLTDEDGSYVELMTGVYTDNQPDFTWLKPYEEKRFQQYFMPYKKLGRVMNAGKECAVNLTVQKDAVTIGVYATEQFRGADIRLFRNDRLIFEQKTDLSPKEVFESTVSESSADPSEVEIIVSYNGKVLISYRPDRPEIPEYPSPQEPAKEPEELQTNEELYLNALHLMQYRHATYSPEPYFLEGLKRDPLDSRINTAYGRYLLQKGLKKEAEEHFRAAIRRLTERNPNPYTGEPHYNLGLTLKLQGRTEEAYDAFYKAAWCDEQKEQAYYQLAAIDAAGGRYLKALSHVQEALVKNSRNVKALSLRAYLYRKLGMEKEALRAVSENLSVDPFDFVSGYEAVILSEEGASETLLRKMRNFPENFLYAARTYFEFGAYQEAEQLLTCCNLKNPLLSAYRAYACEKGGEPEEIWMELLSQADRETELTCFPNKEEDETVLSFAVEHGCTGEVAYLLGNLYYDRKRYNEAESCFAICRDAHPEHAGVRRNLALLFMNIHHDGKQAMELLTEAFRLDPSDARIFFELDDLRKKLGADYEERLSEYEKYPELVASRDDLYTEYVTVLNMTGRYREALQKAETHRFHPWEGGEGKITTQYVNSLLALSEEALRNQAYEDAEALLRKALVYPENLGEGKLEGTKDNHLYYALGLALSGQGRTAEAEKCFLRATIGTDEPAGAMYYNDQPADMILYQGLSFLKLHETGKAKARFYRLLDYGERHVNDRVRIEYFAVSLPDLLTFDSDLTKRNGAHCSYLMGLSAIGLSDLALAKRHFEEALQKDSTHMMSFLYLRRLRENSPLFS